MDLNQITIPSLDVEKSTAFYKILGLHLIVDAAPRYVRFECPNGDSTFSIHKVNELQKGNGITIYFEDNNLDELVKQLKRKDIIFTNEPEDKTWLCERLIYKILMVIKSFYIMLEKTGKTHHGALINL